MISRKIPNSQKSTKNSIEFRLYFGCKPPAKEKTIYNTISTQIHKSRYEISKYHKSSSLKTTNPDSIAMPGIKSIIHSLIIIIKMNNSGWKINDNRNIVITTRQSSADYEDYHLIRERARERVDHHGMEQMTTLNLEMRKESVSKTMYLVKEEINKKPTR